MEEDNIKLSEELSMTVNGNYPFKNNKYFVVKFTVFYEDGNLSLKDIEVTEETGE